MRILVTGSLGVLGTPLVAELRDRGHEVWGCDLTHSGDPQYIRADVAEYHQLDHVYGQAHPDVVYHLAAEFGRLNGEIYTEQLWRTAMVGTRNVLDLCSHYGAKLLFASSSEVYGDFDAEWLHEDLTEAARSSSTRTSTRYRSGRTSARSSPTRTATTSTPSGSGSSTPMGPASRSIPTAPSLPCSATRP